MNKIGILGHHTPGAFLAAVMTVLGADVLAEARVFAETLYPLPDPEPVKQPKVKERPVKVLYHLRHRNGVSVDMMDSTRSAAIESAREARCQCFELRGGVATLVYEPPLIRATEG